MLVPRTAFVEAELILGKSHMCSVFASLQKGQRRREKLPWKHRRTADLPSEESCDRVDVARDLGVGSPCLHPHSHIYLSLAWAHDFESDFSSKIKCRIRISNNNLWLSEILRLKLVNSEAICKQRAVQGHGSQ